MIKIQSNPSNKSNHVEDHHRPRAHRLGLGLRPGDGLALGDVSDAPPRAPALPWLPDHHLSDPMGLASLNDANHAKPTAISFRMR